MSIAISKRMRKIPAGDVEGVILWMSWFGNRGFIGLGIVEQGDYLWDMVLIDNSPEMISASRWSIRVFSVVNEEAVAELIAEGNSGDLKRMREVAESAAVGKELLRGVILKQDIEVL